MSIIRNNFLEGDCLSAYTILKKLELYDKYILDNKVLQVAGRTGDIVLTKVDVGLENVDNTSDANKPISTTQQTALDLKLNTSLRGVANGVASLDAGVKIPYAQLPDLTVANFVYGAILSTGEKTISSIAGKQMLSFLVQNLDSWNIVTLPKKIFETLTGTFGLIINGSDADTTKIVRVYYVNDTTINISTITGYTGVIRIYAY